jgi:hypothetical protein
MGCFSQEVGTNAEQMFAVKGPSVVIGYMWNEALSMTFDAMILESRHSGSLSDPYQLEETIPPPGHPDLWKKALVRISVFVATVFVVTWIGRSSHMCETAKTVACITLVETGLNLIPAWTFKDGVTIFLSTMKQALGMDLAWLWAFVLMLLCSAVIACLPEKKPRDEQGLCAASFAMIGVSFGLGIGFAFNHIPQHDAGKFYDMCEFQNVYAPLVTFIAYVFAGMLDTSFKDCSDYLKRVLTFLKTSLVFLAAWGWQALYDQTFEGWYPVQTGFHGEFLREIVSAAVLCLLCILLAVEVRQPLFVQLAAINVGWAWMDVASTAYNHTLEDSDSGMMKVAKLWGVTAVVTIVCPLIAALTHLVLGCAVEEPASDEEKDPHSYVQMKTKASKSLQDQQEDDLSEEISEIPEQRLCC